MNVPPCFLTSELKDYRFLWILSIKIDVQSIISTRKINFARPQAQVEDVPEFRILEHLVAISCLGHTV